jgi:2,3-dihydroxybiphenyl 1,2-dioxygenase
MSRVAALGYLVFEVSDLAAWERFATDQLGLALGERRSDGSLALRMDEYEQRIVLVPGKADDLAVLGWEVADAGELDALVRRLADAGVAVEEGKPELAQARRVQRVVCFQDPSGIPCEAYFGPAMSNEPFRSSRLLSRFVTGGLGLGHAVICARNVEASFDFYTNALGLRLSDRVFARLSPTFELAITFLHANPRHHSIAFASVPMPKRIHHFMLEVEAMDDVGRAYDRFVDAGAPIAQTLGRHPNDRMFSFYGVTPSGFQVEFGWGGVQVDDATWRTRSYHQTSEWGHRPPQAGPRG